MNVAFFSNQFASREGHGIKRYSVAVIEALGASGVTVTPVAGWSSHDPSDLARLKAGTGLELTGLGRNGTKLLWTFAGWPPLESRISAPVDVVHAAALGYPVATRKPFVVTIHDLGPLTHPEFFTNTRPWVMERALRQAVKQAAAIICVSESTAQEVRDVAGPAVLDRLHVVLEGVEPEFFDPVDPVCLEGLDLPPPAVPFVLTAGKISPRKNVGRVIEAMGRLKDVLPHHLVLVGGDGWGVDAVRRAVAEAGLEGRLHPVGFVSNDQLRALYQRASVYVHPSLYEGFGLTVLEAMASGVPVITSDRTSLPEVAGDAAVQIDPTRVDAIAAAIEAVCTDSGLAARLVGAGLDRARAFTWDKAAGQMTQLYRDIARGAWR